MSDDHTTAVLGRDLIALAEVAPVDPAEQGEWFEPAYLEEHRAGAVRLTLSEGDAKTQDFTVKQ